MFEPHAVVAFVHFLPSRTTTLDKFLFDFSLIQLSGSQKIGLAHLAVARHYRPNFQRQGGTMELLPIEWQSATHGGPHWQEAMRFGLARPHLKN